jgi:mevalonate kinase
MTSDCVNKVKRLFESDPVRAKEIDGRMHEAVAMCETALSQDSPDAFNLLRRALMMAASCFEDWGLSEGDLGRHLKELEQAGAVAVKPTGSGGGGFALSLWTENPPASLLGRLIPVPGDK